MCNIFLALNNTKTIRIYFFSMAFTSNAIKLNNGIKNVLQFFFSLLLGAGTTEFKLNKVEQVIFEGLHVYAL